MRFALIVFVILCTGCQRSYEQQAMESMPKCSYVRAAAELFPDPVCTPGAIDPLITRSNIQTTVCRQSCAASLMPSVATIETAKGIAMAFYQLSDQSMTAYALDWLIPLDLGGSALDPGNHWPLPWDTAARKQTVMNQLRELACSERMLLADAQRRIATNWLLAAADAPTADGTPTPATGM